MRCIQICRRSWKRSTGNSKEKKKWTGCESFRKLRRFSRPVFTLPKDMFIDMDIDEKWYSKANLDDYHTMYIGEITEILAR